MEIKSSFGEHTINQFLLMFDKKQVNLEPGFQRKSVWTLTDRRRLIQSIFAGYPLPSIFLYQRSHNGGLVYDVIDGKQRLETILMFAGQGHFRSSTFDVKLDFGEGPKAYCWKDLCRSHHDKTAAFFSYKTQTVEVTGDLSQIIELFVCINSTGKQLTSGEKRHAKFYTSRFLKEASKLVVRHKDYLLRERILTLSQIDRMKGTELFAELLMSLHHGGIINKKTALDRAIGNDAVKANVLDRLLKEFTSTMTALKGAFPGLRETRFHNTAEFYSLFLLVWEMNKERLVLSDRNRNGIAMQLLVMLSTGVDELREQLRKVKPAKSGQRLYSDYLLTVQGDTDSSANRERRRELLRGLLVSIFEKKDERRLFTPEQRRIIWNSDEKRVCAACKMPLTWEDFSADHLIAHAKGGRTTIENAQVMHKACNSRKGAK